MHEYKGVIVKPGLCSEQQLFSCDIPVLWSCLKHLSLSLASLDPAAGVGPPAAPVEPAQLHSLELWFYGCTACLGPEHPYLKILKIIYKTQKITFIGVQLWKENRIRRDTCFNQLLDEFFLHANGDRQLPDLLLSLKKSPLRNTFKTFQTFPYRCFPTTGVSYTRILEKCKRLVKWYNDKGLQNFKRASERQAITKNILWKCVNNICTVNSGFKTLSIWIY